MPEGEANPNSQPLSGLPAQSKPGRVAAIDFGQARIGLALSDVGRTLASPAGVFPRRSPPEEATFFRRFAEQHEVTLFVVGLPLHLSGQESPLSQQARQFGHWLQKVTGIPVVFFDERFSSWEADRALAAAGLKASFRRRKRDTVAAQKILAAYLEHEAARKGSTSGSGAVDQDPPSTKRAVPPHED